MNHNNSDHLSVPTWMHVVVSYKLPTPFREVGIGTLTLQMGTQTLNDLARAI